MSVATTNRSIEYATPAVPSAASWLAVPGRVLMSIIFLLSGFGKIANWSMMAGLMATKTPAPKVMLALAIFAELVGGLSLLLGFLTRIGAVGLLIFLIPTTLLFHNFWAAPEAQHQEQMINFLKNLAIMGGLLMVAAYGAGPLSIDSAMRKRA